MPNILAYRKKLPANQHQFLDDTILLESLESICQKRLRTFFYPQKFFTAAVSGQHRAFLELGGTVLKGKNSSFRELILHGVYLVGLLMGVCTTWN